jgi:hypothetical protein
MLAPPAAPVMEAIRCATAAATMVAAATRRGSAMAKDKVVRSSAVAKSAVGTAIGRARSTGTPNRRPHRRGSGRAGRRARSQSCPEGSSPCTERACRRLVRGDQARTPGCARTVRPDPVNRGLRDRKAHRAAQGGTIEPRIDDMLGRGNDSFRVGYADALDLVPGRKGLMVGRRRRLQMRPKARIARPEASLGPVVISRNDHCGI